MSDARAAERAERATAGVASATRRAREASAALGAGCVLHVVAAFGDAVSGHAGRELGVLSVIVGVASAVTYLAWVQAAHATASLLRPDFRSALTPAEAARAYLVPVTNLVVPLGNMEALAHMSDPRDLPVAPPRPRLDPMASYRDNAQQVTETRPWQRPRPRVVAWWMSALAAAALGVSARWIERAPSVIGAAWQLAYLALHLVAAWLCVQMMHAITELQRERARRLEAFARA